MNRKVIIALRILSGLLIFVVAAINCKDVLSNDDYYLIIILLLTALGLSILSWDDRKDRQSSSN